MIINYKSVKGEYSVNTDDKWTNLCFNNGKIEYNGVTIHLLLNGESGEDIKVGRKTRVVRSLDEMFDEFDRVDKNNQKVQTRRHCSIEAITESHGDISSNTDIETDYTEYEDAAEICGAIGKLAPAQRDLRKRCCIGTLR